MCEQVAQRVEPLLRSDSKKFDIWLASNGMSSLAGFPFTSWRVDETVVIDTCDPDSNSISTRFVDIRYFADTPRIFWAFVGNVIVYFVLTMLSSVGIQNWMRWRIRNRTAFPFELV